MKSGLKKADPHQSRLDFDAFDGEMYLSRRLEEQGYHVFMGVTDRQTRQERLREAIMARGCDSTIIGAIPGTRRPETYSAAWERIYGAAFHVKPKRGAA